MAASLFLCGGATAVRPSTSMPGARRARIVPGAGASRQSSKYPVVPRGPLDPRTTAKFPAYPDASGYEPRLRRREVELRPRERERASSNTVRRMEGQSATLGAVLLLQRGITF